MNSEVKLFSSADQSIDQLHAATLAKQRIHKNKFSSQKQKIVLNHVWLQHLQSDVLTAHASNERLKSLNVLFLCLFCDGLQNTLMATK